MNAWEKIYGARRRATDRRLLASMEREIAQSEKAGRTRYDGTERDTIVGPAPDLTEASAWKEERARIARAFGRPLPETPRGPTYK